MKDDHLTLRLPADLARALARAARTRGLPRSQVVREALAGFLHPPATEVASARPVARDVARRWPALPRLLPEEAGDFARDLDASRSQLPALDERWE